jgi:hypothetical protein
MGTIQQRPSACEPFIGALPQHLLRDEILSRLPLEDYESASRVCKAFQRSCHEIHQQLETRKQLFRKNEALEEQLSLFGISSKKSTQKKWKKLLIKGHRISFQIRPDRLTKYLSNLRKRLEGVQAKLPEELKTEFTADALALSLPLSDLENFLRQATKYAFDQLAEKPFDQIGMAGDSDEELQKKIEQSLPKNKRKAQWQAFENITNMDWDFIIGMSDCPSIHLSQIANTRITNASEAPLPKQLFKAAKKIVEKTLPRKRKSNSFVMFMKSLAKNFR